MGGLAIRGLYLMEASAGPTFQMPVVDAHVYHQAAVGLVRGEGFSSSYFFQPFFYPFWLASLYWVSGTSS